MATFIPSTKPQTGFGPSLFDFSFFGASPGGKLRSAGLFLCYSGMDIAPLSF